MAASLDDFWIYCDNFAHGCGIWLKKQWDKFAQKSKEVKKKVRPLASSTYTAGLALYTFYTTSQVCISMLPVVLSSITLFAAIPFLHNLSSPIIYASVISISMVAGYFKYHDLLHRQKLDAQIKKNKQCNKELVAQIKELKEKLEERKDIDPSANPRKLTRKKPVISQAKVKTKAKPKAQTASVIHHERKKIR